MSCQKCSALGTETQDTVQSSSENDMGYARVSTTDQTVDPQSDALSAAGFLHSLQEVGRPSPGRRPSPEDDVDETRTGTKDRENGMHLTDIAEIIGAGRTTLYRHLK